VYQKAEDNEMLRSHLTAHPLRVGGGEKR